VLIGCGTPYIGTTLAIVDPETRAACPVGHVGEIWVRGPCVASGYWNRAEETEALFRARIAGSNDGPYLRTGDLGFLRDGEVYITGRWKDLIILRGRNLYPSDLELSSEKSHAALRPGCGAAFSVDVAGEERLVVAHERDPKKPGEPDEVIWAIRAAIAEDHEVHAQAVVLIAPGSLPKTSSGKIRRRECRRQYLAEELNVQRLWTARS
jgi:acyl-CoA synthetase (AMP-forming)/AMP-acid ligase II